MLKLRDIFPGEEDKFDFEIYKSIFDSVYSTIVPYENRSIEIVHKVTGVKLVLCETVVTSLDDPSLQIISRRSIQIYKEDRPIEYKNRFIGKWDSCLESIRAQMINIINECIDEKIIELKKYENSRVKGENL